MSNKSDLFTTNEQEEFDYLVFVLGYDLLHRKLMNCENRECDTVFDTLKEIVTLFFDSGENMNYSQSTYDNLCDFLENNELEIDRILFNELDYKGLKFGE